MSPVVFVYLTGSYKHGGRRGPPHNGRVTDGSLIIGEGKPSKKGASSSFGLHEVSWSYF